MKRSLALVVVGSLVIAGPTQASALPRVYIGYPNRPPCDESTKTHGKYVDHRVACYQVKPSTISFSEDGNGFLSDITWSVWTGNSAKGTALQTVRCFGIPRGQRTDPHCGPYRCSNSGGVAFCSPRIFGYNVPATIRLSVPVTTRAGVDFTRLRVSSSHREAACLPPADSC